jgi:hypothetical protein
VGASGGQRRAPRFEAEWRAVKAARLPRLALASLLIAGGAEAGSLRIEGVAWGRGIGVRSQPSWLSGGFGRLTEGAGAPSDSAFLGRGQLHVGLEWRPSELLLVHVHGFGRVEGAAAGGEPAGVAEAFLQYRPELSPTVALRLRAGTFFPQTSRENVGPLWSSPYTLTFSALNAWIGEEARLTGLDGTLRVRSAGGSEMQASGALFGAADTMGALLAWRGWSFGDRLTGIGETLPLPPLPSLAPGGGFERQRRGTKPVGELDGRLGWQARVRWQRSGRALLQAAYTDNAGDRELHRGQYSWRTRFAQAGAELQVARSVILVGEAAIGDSGMGPTGSPHVDIRFRVAYGLLSWGGETARVSVRSDWFRNEDRDGTAEPDGETGHAWTAAALWRAVKHVRLGVEYQDVRGARPAAAFSSASPDAGARRLMGEARLVF